METVAVQSGFGEGTHTSQIIGISLSVRRRAPVIRKTVERDLRGIDSAFDVHRQDKLTLPETPIGN